MKKSIGGLILSLIFSSSFAEAPVVDYSTSAGSSGSNKAFRMPSSGSAVDMGGRINRIERQIENINEQDLINRIEELQQTVQKLTGKVESQEYQIEQLTGQVKDFYKDLDGRLEGADSGSKKTLDAATTVLVNGAVVPATAGVDLDVQKKSSKEDLLKEQQVYQAAIDLLPEKKQESKDRLRSYLKRYPKGLYVSNAHYWLGEINFLEKSFDRAEEEFKIVISKYKKSKRVSDAAFKLALVHQNQGKAGQSKKELNEVIKDYPGTSAAQLAKQQLKVNK